MRLKWTTLSKNTHLARIEKLAIFLRNSIIMSEHGTQEDPEALTLLGETIQSLVKQLESKTNFWFFYDVHSADDYDLILQDIKKIQTLEQKHGLSFNKTTSTQNVSFSTQFCNFVSYIAKQN